MAAFALAKAEKHMFIVPSPIVNPHTTVYLAVQYSKLVQTCDVGYKDSLQGRSIADKMDPPVLQCPKGGDPRQQSSAMAMPSTSQKLAEQLPE